MKMLITGGAGFIGSHLAEELLNRGHEVYVIDDLSTGSIHNISHLKFNNKFHYIIDTIFKDSLLAELVDECDVIFHLAAMVGVNLIVHSPVQTLDMNISGTNKVLNAANKKHKLVIFASTSEVYGKSDKVPFREDSDIVLGPTTKGRWSYACSKAVDEFLALAYHKEMNLPVIIVRFFNTVGPRQTGRYGMVVPRFVRQALKGDPVTVYGSGKQTRCFTYVGDVVKAVCDLAKTPKAVGQIFNIGNNQELTILQLAKKVIKLTKSHSKIQFISYDKAYEDGFEDMHRRVPDISKAWQYIKYKPQVSLDETIALIVEYFKSRDNFE